MPRQARTRTVGESGGRRGGKSRRGAQDGELRITVGETHIVPIDSIHPWKDNPRIIDEHDKFMMAMLKEHGQASPLQVWRKDNSIRKGNRTWHNMKTLGFKEVAINYKDFDSDTQADSYAMGDNAASEKGKWDTEKRYLLMQAEHMANVKPVQLGLTDKEFKSIMLGGIKPEKLPEVDITGDQSGLSFSIILQFDDEDTFLKFKRQAGITVKHQRILQYKQFVQYFRPSTLEDSEPSGRGRRSRR